VTRRKSVDVLLPIDFIVTGLLGLAAVAILFFVGAAVFGSGSVYGIGESTLCLETRAGMSSGVPAQYAHPLVPGVASGSTVEPVRVSICAPATRGIHLYYAAEAVPAHLFAIGVLAVLYVLIKVARRGLFTKAVVRMVRALGWYLTLGTLAVTVLEAMATAGLFHDLVPGQSGVEATAFLHVDLTLLITGIGIVTLARVLRVAARMQREIDATV
jgi:hypothetical protein